VIFGLGVRGWKIRILKENKTMSIIQYQLEEGDVVTK
jgi:hypothetical protein